MSAEPEAPASVAALQALSERSLRRAGESLSALLGHGVRLTASGVELVSPDALPAWMGSAAPGTLGGLRFQITGQGSGYLLVFFPMPALLRMLEALLGRGAAGEGFTEIERSAFREMGNVLASSFLSELGDLTRRRFLPSTPQVLLDDLPRAVADTLAALERRGRRAVMVRGLFEDPRHEIQGHFFILPEVDGGAEGEWG